MPDVKIHCISLYKKSSEEYSTQEPLSDYIDNYYMKTAYVNPANKPTDHIDSSMTSGYQNIDNGKYFVEGFNYVYEKFGHLDEKVLMLAEDHFFTKAKTLQFLRNTDYDLAYAPWDSIKDANASIISINFSKVDCFPLPVPEGVPVEIHLKYFLVMQVPYDRKVRIPTRVHIDYMGDGKYTNSSEEIKLQLQKVGIL